MPQDTEANPKIQGKRIFLHIVSKSLSFDHCLTQLSFDQSVTFQMQPGRRNLKKRVRVLLILRF